MVTEKLIPCCSIDQRPLKAIKLIDPGADIRLIKGGPLTPEVMEAAKAIGSKRIGAKMEGTTRLVVKEAQKQGFKLTGWPGHNLEYLAYCEHPAHVDFVLFDFAAASVVLHVPFTLTPSDLSQLAANLSQVESLRQASAAVLRPLYEQLLPAIQNPL